MSSTVKLKDVCLTICDITVENVMINLPVKTHPHVKVMRLDYKDMSGVWVEYLTFTSHTHFYALLPAPYVRD